ncbi:endonuclease MutS2 [Bacteroidota bacterium]
MIYPKSFEDKVGFSAIREFIKDACQFELGRTEVDNICFSDDIEYIDEQIQLSLEFRQIIEFEDNYPLGHFINIIPSINKIRIEGSFLAESEIFDLNKTLDNFRGIQHFLNKSEAHKYSFLKNMAKTIHYFPFITEQIDKILNRFGELKDNASNELLNIRSKLKEKKGSISKKINLILKKAQTEGLVDEGEAANIRDGRMVIPVPVTHKRKMKGYIHDESASGKTVYIEPAEVVEINNEIKELEHAEKREKIKILIQFSNVIRPYCDELIRLNKFVGKMDFIRAKALFAIQSSSVKPSYHERQYLNWRNARHPILEMTLIKENKKIVPLQIELNHNKRILVISGPNAGGKSVCLQTVGLLQYMFQCGIMIPVSENSEFGIFKNIFIDIGDEQSIENDLSTYSSHLLNMKTFVKNSDANTLFLIDEFGTGTEPLLGGSIAESILDQLNKSESFGIITTHYTNLKHFASSEKGIENAAMLYDTSKLEPLFQLRIGEPGSSFAFEIARKIGLPEYILKSAEEKIGKKHVDYDRNLKNIIRDKRYWETKRKKIRLNEKKLEEIIDNYSKELEDLSINRKKILQKAKDEANSILSDANKKIENTISEIRKLQAEKQQTKKIRKELENFKERIANSEQEDDVIEMKEKIIKQYSLKNKTKEQKIKEPAKQKSKAEIMTGDMVKLIGQVTVGEVIAISGNNFTIAFGNIKTTVKKEKIEKTSDQNYKYSTIRRKASIVDLNEKKLHFKSHIDVRGMRTEEALIAVNDLIDNAVMVNMNSIKILHGKGNGILKQFIREFLLTVEIVKKFFDEHADQGGSGITVVELDL